MTATTDRLTHATRRLAEARKVAREEATQLIRRLSAAQRALEEAVSADDADLAEELERAQWEVERTESNRDCLRLALAHLDRDETVAAALREVLDCQEVAR